MKLDSSTLFVNTGRKALPAMQKKKKTSKNTVALAICIAIIAVLCVFVGLIAYVWVNYNAEVKPPQEIVAPQEEKEIEAPKTEEKPKAEEKPKTANKTRGKKTAMSNAVTKAFKELDAQYSFGIQNINDGYTYINNTEEIHNSSALGAFLLEYVSNAIYMGTFDYTTNVAGYTGDYLMNRAFSEGSVEAANLLIEHFGSERLNAYFESKGYTGTKFGGTIGNGDGSYTTSEDILKLMRKMYDNTGFFPYSDMYKKMTINTIDNKLAAMLPEGVSIANISFEEGDEVFDAGVIYTPQGSFILTAMADGDLESSRTAFAKAALGVCTALADAGDISE